MNGEQKPVRTTLSLRRRFQILQRDNFKCQYCGAGADVTTLEVDHVEPVAEGGDDSPENLVTACRECNAGKGARYAFQGMVGYGRPVDDERSPQFFFCRDEMYEGHGRLIVPWTLPAFATLWQLPRVYSYQEAVVDLAYRSWTCHARSIEDLAPVWQWSEADVRAFLGWVVEARVLYKVRRYEPGFIP